MMSKYFKDYADILNLIKDDFQINLFMRLTQMFASVLAKAIVTPFRGKMVSPKMSMVNALVPRFNYT